MLGSKETSFGITNRKLSTAPMIMTSNVWTGDTGGRPPDLAWRIETQTLSTKCENSELLRSNRQLFDHSLLMILHHNSDRQSSGCLLRNNNNNKALKSKNDYDLVIVTIIRGAMCTTARA